MCLVYVYLFFNVRISKIEDQLESFFKIFRKVLECMDELNVIKSEKKKC